MGLKTNLYLGGHHLVWCFSHRNAFHFGLFTVPLGQSVPLPMAARTQSRQSFAMACRLGQYTLRHEVGGSNLNKLGEVNKENVVRISLMLFCSYTFCSCKMYWTWTKIKRWLHVVDFILRFVSIVFSFHLFQYFGSIFLIRSIKML